MRKVIAVVIVNLLILPAFLEARQISKAELIRDANILFLKGNYGAVIGIIERSKVTRPLSGREKKELLYLTGLSYLKSGSYAKARHAFNKILDLKGGEYREYAYIGIADSYFKEGKFDRAISVYEYTASIYPGSDRLSSVYYNLALSHKAKKDLNKETYYLQKIKKRYGKSFEAQEIGYISREIKPGYYIIQLGAFRSLKNARKLLKRLRKKGFESYIQKAKKGGVILYRVRGGKFSNKYYATKLARKLRRRGFSVKIIEE